ncbi:lactonase family protein [Lachnoclostridium sp. Marseille-P6806]|uniref:lactonase family protein n=1 Tax=Lachnoclostridium sp. Marseille-P6806 TaxID=2364793 RepID=UPI0013EF43FF|nr:beta-propeller fold lactonase family protein [Lachnoclostridium sp. Marseille-P6806]
MNYTGYAGTYTGSGSQGIYRFQCRDGILSEAALFARAENPKYLCFFDGMIAAAVDFSAELAAKSLPSTVPKIHPDDNAGIALFRPNGERVQALAYERGSSCYLCAGGDFLYSANYHTGVLSAIRADASKDDPVLTLAAQLLIADHAGAHQALPFGEWLLVPCLFLDRIVLVDRIRFRITGNIGFEPGAGPRHGVFSEDLRFLYVIGELSGALYAVDMQSFSVVNRLPLLPDGELPAEGSAAIRRAGNLLYVSTRGQDLLSVVRAEGSEMRLLQTCSSGGRHPRDFVLTEDGRLIAANRFSHSLVSMERAENGLLGRSVSSAAVPEAVSIILREQ